MSKDAAPPPAAPSAAVGTTPTEIPRVAFEHPFFGKLEDAFFQKSEQGGEPLLVIRFAKNHVSLPF